MHTAFTFLSRLIDSYYSHRKRIRKIYLNRFLGTYLVAANVKEGEEGCSNELEEEDENRVANSRLEVSIIFHFN